MKKVVFRIIYDAQKFIEWIPKAPMKWKARGLFSPNWFNYHVFRSRF